MKTGKFADLIIRNLGGGDQDFQIDTRDVLATAELVLGSMLAQLVDGNKTIPDGYYSTQVCKIQKDDVRALKYIEPSPGFVSLPMDAGVKSVGAIQEEQSAYTILKSGMLSSIKNLEVSNIPNRVFVWIETGRIYFTNLPPSVDEVLVRMIPYMSELDEDDDVFSMDSIGLQVADAVTQRLSYRAQKPEDKTNDNKPD